MVRSARAGKITNGVLRIYAIQEQSPETQIRSASRRRKDLRQDIRRVEPWNRSQETSRKSDPENGSQEGKIEIHTTEGDEDSTIVWHPKLSVEDVFEFEDILLIAVTCTKKPSVLEKSLCHRFRCAFSRWRFLAKTACREGFPLDGGPILEQDAHRIACGVWCWPCM
jgi:hypothetical protein